MTEKDIKHYLKIRNMNPKDRLTRDGGGQYLINFLIGFAKDVELTTIAKVKNKIRELED
jgi:hypothetical protein